ncbi:MAG TPA: hypothetical protein EYP63_07545 [Desulfotomaculum sp.]|nr:hypothetical protein [Desulfotomaculum sp.]
MTVSPAGRVQAKTLLTPIGRVQADGIKTLRTPADEQAAKKSVEEHQADAAREFAEAVERLKETAKVFGWRIHFKLHEELQQYYVRWWGCW